MAAKVYHSKAAAPIYIYSRHIIWVVWCKQSPVNSGFFRAFRGEILISPQNNNKFCGCFSHFLCQQKQFPPLNYISRKNSATEYNHEAVKTIMKL